MKNKPNTKISYDADADVLRMESTTRARIDHAEEMGNLVVHFTKQNKPVLVEVLEASRLFKKHQNPARSAFRFLDREPNLYSTANLKKRYV